MIAAADQAVFDAARDLLRGDIETDDTRAQPGVAARVGILARCHHLRGHE